MHDEKHMQNHFLNKMEAVCWFFCTCVYFTWYNPIGEIGKANMPDHINNPSLLMRVDQYLSWMDDLVPYMPWLVIPYIAVYAMPAMYLVSLCWTHGLDMAKVRRFFITQMCMITTAFAIYILCPVRTNLIEDAESGRQAALDKSWISQLCIKFVHQGISLYVASPSMHTAHAFSVAAAFSADKLRGSLLAWVLAIITLASTCGTKAHTPPHLAFGLALAAIAQVAVFQTLTRHLRLLQPKSNSWLRFYAIAAAPLAFIVVGEELHRISGWNTDLPAMFGFETNPVRGLYGLRLF
jgi:hypothetical protein